MGGFSLWHWAIVLLVVILIFGTKKLRSIGSDLGGAVKNFKESVKEEEPKQAQQDVQVIEGEVTSRVQTKEKSGTHV